MDFELITAIATPPGFGGVGIIRVSGKTIPSSFIKKLVKIDCKPRHAHYTQIYDDQASIIDEGIVIFYPSPYSYTGEDVLEIQCHGGAIVQRLVLEATLKAGARLAQPGEFTHRAFLNNKMDLTQAEAVIDLIHADSEYAAKCALKSLQGQFSEKINQLLQMLISLRMFVESAIDFPDEDIEFIESERVVEKLKQIQNQLVDIINTAKQGVLLKEGMTVVIAGKPNAGKSSLLNQLSGRESAIVTEIAGTTRDVLREHIHLDGLPLHIIDTAGLRDTHDMVEQEGVKRAKLEMAKADLILLIVDASEEDSTSIAALQKDVRDKTSHEVPILIVNNKSDLLIDANHKNNDEIFISAKLGQGIDKLKKRLQDQVGYQVKTEGAFIARARHLDALQTAAKAINQGCEQLQKGQAPELLAEDLRQAQMALNTITGEFSSDDLLGEIFSNFCIGK